MDPFLGTLHIKVEMSGLSSNFRQVVQSAFGGFPDDDPMEFDPSDLPRGPLSKIVKLKDLQELAHFDLDSQLVVVSTSVKDVKRLANSQKEAVANLTAQLETIDVEEGPAFELETKAEPEARRKSVAKLTADASLKPVPRTEPEIETKPQVPEPKDETHHKKKPSTFHDSVNGQDTFLVELWRAEWSGLPGLTPAAGQLENNPRKFSRISIPAKLGTQPHIFGDGVPSDLWPTLSTGDVLRKYFPWCSDNQVCINSFLFLSPTRSLRFLCI
jgi:hypothetical protein